MTTAVTAAATTAERIRWLVDRSGLTPQEFAQRAGLDPTRLLSALNGDRRFSSLDLANIADFCEVDVQWLLTGAPAWKLWCLDLWWRIRHAFRLY